MTAPRPLTPAELAAVKERVEYFEGLDDHERVAPGLVASLALSTPALLATIAERDRQIETLRDAARRLLAVLDNCPGRDGDCGSPAVCDLCSYGYEAEEDALKVALAATAPSDGGVVYTQTRDIHPAPGSSVADGVKIDSAGFSGASDLDSNSDKSR